MAIQTLKIARAGGAVLRVRFNDNNLRVTEAEVDATSAVRPIELVIKSQTNPNELRETVPAGQLETFNISPLNMTVTLDDVSWDPNGPGSFPDVFPDQAVRLEADIEFKPEPA